MTSLLEVGLSFCTGGFSEASDIRYYYGFIIARVLAAITLLTERSPYGNDRNGVGCHVCD